jgi:hypothetical protein
MAGSIIIANLQRWVKYNTRSYISIHTCNVSDRSSPSIIMGFADCGFLGEVGTVGTVEAQESFIQATRHPLWRDPVLERFVDTLLILDV